MQKDKFTNLHGQQYNFALDRQQSQCRLQGIITTDKNERIQLKNQTNREVVRVCRICLESQTLVCNNARNPSQYQQIIFNPIIGLPCACRNQMGMIHDKCIKFWIKMWLQGKIAEVRQGHSQQNNNQTQIQQQAQRNEQNMDKRLSKRGKKIKVKPLDIRNLKQDCVYPFPCEICHQPIFFDLNFHFRIKTYMQLTKKDIILFLLPLLFVISFLGICINWFMQSGINMYLIIFFMLVQFPLFVIALAVGIWTFTKKQFWVNGIYQRKNVYRQYEIKAQYLDKLHIAREQATNQQKSKSTKINFKYLKMQFQNLKNKIMKKKSKQKQGKTDVDMRGKNTQNKQSNGKKIGCQSNQRLIVEQDYIYCDKDGQMRGYKQSEEQVEIEIQLSEGSVQGKDRNEESRPSNI